ncbi:MAG TPA: alpha/beta hydrolase [Pseudomonadales bacterium]|nr:alpha/beta hydrolase [Pseudomonadales bacterium]
MHIERLKTDPVLMRNNVNIIGKGKHVAVLAHGFGCDQTMWRFMQPYLENDFRIVLFDYTGCGQSDVSHFDRERYSSLQGYAKDLTEVCDALGIESAVFFGHSVSATIGVIAACQRPELFAEMVLICPSPCFLNFPPDYQGGFEQEDLEELINLMDKNHVGWANYLAPLVIGENPQQEMTTLLANSFCSTDPMFLKPFARATFFSDHRKDLAACHIPCLVIQSANDSLASERIGKYMVEHLHTAVLKVIDANGHCLHMTHPEQVVKAFRHFSRVI